MNQEDVYQADAFPSRVHRGVSEPQPLEDAILEGLRPDLKARGESFQEMAHALTLPFEEDVQAGQAHCQRCETLPQKLRGPGTIYLSVPHTHTLGKVMVWLRGSGFVYGERDGVLTIQAPSGSLVPVVAPLLEILSPTERRMTRVIFRRLDDLLQPTDAFQAEEISTFAARAGADWLIDLLRQKRLTSFFQPIVSCENGREVYAYECLVRGLSEGTLVPPGHIFAIAQQADLIFQVDLAARRAALCAAAEKNVGERIFINFTPNAIFDAAYCLDGTVRLIDELRLPREQIVFEVVESEKLPEIEHLKSIVAYYRDQGFGVALDDVGAGYASLQVLLEIRPDFAKIDMSLTRDVHLDERKAILTRRLIETAGELGSKIVVEGVESREEWAWVRACHVDYAQGYLFGRPQAVPSGASLS